MERGETYLHNKLLSGFDGAYRRSSGFHPEQGLSKQGRVLVQCGLHSNRYFN
ncbi:hypothetical protein DPMN_098900 [Dreissena polymorpha]|uniref:Uncharacterized protein n=1 Tax=Dreissena polymorpha TaxID=45954 RepID=A0A9D4LEI2_DREPO|nr:hypothetical protein DPMN_098900 [Dreissena polymorpha]